MMSKYGIQKTVELSYSDAVTKVKNELKEEGFGVLAAIDPVKALGMSEDKRVNEIAKEIKSRLTRVIENI